jgi:hypothetical protein
MFPSVPLHEKPDANVMMLRAAIPVLQVWEEIQMIKVNVVQDLKNN